jgi:two-component system cell cycle response regulator
VRDADAPPDSRRAPPPGLFLVVGEDERAAVSTALRALGHAVELVDGLGLAQERLLRGGVDVVLVEHRLLGPSPESARIGRLATDGFVPTVALVPRSEPSAAQEALRLGVDDVLTRPTDAVELSARAATLLRLKRAYDEVAGHRARLERTSLTDESTGLYNHRYAATRIAEELRRSERYHEPFALLLFELDARGARVTEARRVAEAARRCLRDVDVLMRQASGELLALLPSTHLSGALTVAERLVRELPRAVEPRTHKAQASIGVALFPSRDARTREALVRAAEAALAQARREGGERVCVFHQQGVIHSAKAR